MDKELAEDVSQEQGTHWPCQGVCQQLSFRFDFLYVLLPSCVCFCAQLVVETALVDDAPEEGTQWPFEGVCQQLTVDIFSPCKGTQDGGELRATEWPETGFNRSRVWAPYGQGLCVELV